MKVVRVLRGIHAPGETVAMYLYDAEKKVGETVVFCEPGRGGLGPSFRHLAAKFEDEVRWLISADRTVTSVEMAIRRARGYSRESRKHGLDYLRALEKHPTAKIIEAIEECRRKGEEYRYEVGCLVDALMQRPDDAACKYVLRQVGAVLERKGAPVDWKKIPDCVSIRGRFLEALVGACGDRWSPMYFKPGTPRAEVHRKLLAEVRALIFEAFPKLDARAMAEATHALVWTGAAEPAELRALLQEGANRDGYALGMDLVGRSSARWRRDREAKAASEEALATATRRELIDSIGSYLPEKHGHEGHTHD